MGGQEGGARAPEDQADGPGGGASPSNQCNVGLWVGGEGVSDVEAGGTLEDGETEEGCRGVDMVEDVGLEMLEGYPFHYRSEEV